MGYVRGGSFNADGTIWMAWHGPSGANHAAGTPTDNEHRLNRYNLSTPWDISTRTFVSNSGPVAVYKRSSTPTLAGFHGCAFNQAGTQFATWSPDNADVEIFELSTAWDPTTLNTTKIGTLGAYTIGSNSSNYGGVSTGVTSDGKTYLVGIRSYYTGQRNVILKTHILNNDLFVTGVHGSASVSYKGEASYSGGGSGELWDDLLQGGAAIWNADGSKLIIMPQKWQYIERSGGGTGGSSNTGWGVFSASTAYDPTTLSADFTRDSVTNYAEEDDTTLRYISQTIQSTCQLQVIQHGEKIVQYSYPGTTIGVWDTGETRRLQGSPIVSGNFAPSLMENSGTAVTTYTATGGSLITWSISGTDAAQFTIDANTGALAFTSAPDYEAPADSGSNNVYNLTVTATNAYGSHSRDVAVTVTDDTSDNGFTSFDMGYTAAGQNKTAPTSQRAWCLERDTSYGYTRYAWFKNQNTNTARQYYWSGSGWTAQSANRTFTALGTNWTGLADSGTLLCGVDTSGNISIVNKSTGSQVASTSHSDNLQGVLWDGTYFWAGSFTTPLRAVRITTGGVVTNYTLPSPSPVFRANGRSAFYDFNKNYYYFGDENAAHAYTFNGSSFTFVGQEASTEWTTQEGEYFEQSDGSKYLIAHNGSTLTSLTPV